MSKKVFVGINSENQMFSCLDKGVAESFLNVLAGKNKGRHDFALLKLERKGEAIETEVCNAGKVQVNIRVSRGADAAVRLVKPHLLGDKPLEELGIPILTRYNHDEIVAHLAMTATPATVTATV